MVSGSTGWLTGRKDNMNLMVKNIATKEEWIRFKTHLAALNLTVSGFFREIVKGAIDEESN